MAQKCPTRTVPVGQIIGVLKMNDKIIIKGAKEHNLKNINLEIPRDKMIVVTGLSGSENLL